MLLKMDDYISRAFFSKNVLIVEGDTEDIVLRETISLMPDKIRDDILHNWQIIKARGKASIVSLVKYLSAAGIVPYILHDRDLGTERAEIFNEPILNSIGFPERVFTLNECIEDVLGYNPPSYEKPSKAYTFIQQTWKGDWNNIREEWRRTVELIFKTSFNKDINSTNIPLEEILKEPK